MQMKFFLKCNEAAEVCDKSQYKEAGPVAKLMLMIHIFICKNCRGYSKNNKKLTDTIQSAKLKTLCPESKQLLKTQIKEEIIKEQHS